VIEHVEVLMVEDNLIDRMALTRYVKHEGLPYTIHEAASLQDARSQLQRQPVDLVLLDYSLEDGSGFELLGEAQSLEVPVILVTGAGSEEIAARAIHSGIADYLIKDTQGKYLATLPSRINAVMSRVLLERERVRLLNELQEALSTINTLRGLIPICAGCKRIRKDDGYWESVEAFVSRHSLAEFSHGFCPECYEEQVRELRSGGSD
jgi:DNA-binding response OmpR family regulator